MSRAGPDCKSEMAQVKDFIKSERAQLGGAQKTGAQKRVFMKSERAQLGEAQKEGGAKNEGPKREAQKGRGQTAACHHNRL